MLHVPAPAGCLTSSCKCRLLQLQLFYESEGTQSVEIVPFLKQLVEDDPLVKKAVRTAMKNFHKVAKTGAMYEGHDFGGWRG